ncbi:hypothetical protein BKA62DRAFT_680317 [Auriculariales sp. MPI-PUGE-AT-0066]|nr:hypothetical protein BKA62DRAFT_680317 [Auriculariales sp. MPI-PUGE-AT-0066]
MDDDAQSTKDDEPNSALLLYLPIEVDEQYDEPGQYYGLWHNFPNSTTLAKQTIQTAIRHYKKDRPVCPVTTARKLWKWKVTWPSEAQGYEQPPIAMRVLFSFAEATMKVEGLLKEDLVSVPAHPSVSPPASPAKATRSAKARRKMTDAPPTADTLPEVPAVAVLPEAPTAKSSKKKKPTQTTLWGTTPSKLHR